MIRVILQKYEILFQYVFTTYWGDLKAKIVKILKFVRDISKRVGFFFNLSLNIPSIINNVTVNTYIEYPY